MKRYFYKINLKFKSTKGQGMVEYALIIGLVALILIVVLSAVPEPISEIFSEVSKALEAEP